MRKTFATLRFTVWGSSGAERARALVLLWAEHREQLADPSSWDGVKLAAPHAPGPCVHVIVTVQDDHRGIDAVDHALLYAKGALEDEVVAAGGSLWDATHVELRP